MNTYVELAKKYWIHALAGIGAILLVWIILHSITPSSQEDQFIQAVKQVRKADANLDVYIPEVLNNAKNIDTAYGEIQKNGNGGRFYSKYNISSQSGVITIEKNNFNQ